MVNTPLFGVLPSQIEDSYLQQCQKLSGIAELGAIISKHGS